MTIMMINGINAIESEIVNLASGIVPISCGAGPASFEVDFIFRA
jgi:hypothetical protein